MVWARNFGLAIYFYTREWKFIGCEFTEKWAAALQKHASYNMKKWLESIGDKDFWW